MREKNYTEVKGIVKKLGINQFEIDFNKLSLLTKNHEKFMEKVKTNLHENNGSFEKIVVFIEESKSLLGKDKGEEKTYIYIVFDHHDTYIRLFGCDIDHENYPFIFEFSQNKTFVSLMAELL